MKLRDAVCVITGGSSGIGRATAIELAKRGATVALVGRNRERLESARAEVAGHSLDPMVQVCDVGDPSAVEKMSGAVLAKYGRIDLLMANAGFGHYRTLGEVGITEIDDMLRTNVLGQIYCARAVLPHMMEQRRGHLVFVSSTNGRIPPPLMSIYNATKFANVGFAESLLYEVEPFGIGVTIVYPGAIETEFFASAEFARMPTPKKIPAERVARAIARGVERNSYDVSVPRVLRIPAVLRMLAPTLVRRGVRRYASAVVPKPPRP